ncbi:hypothetical protein BCR34DRAFT_499289 [Clohesyomyces aquaticus]|uniref:Uncharacterized protein n=1 Tax=Clohesyomyces aquaticus TaxID=1231657 RepID=A0A1Y1Y8Q3_9PLEO|nr:hypothetical protein BCR34DRAFT_499289 [Clohesyomyces aquaticus]
MANLYVAIYKPRGGNVHHWALWLEGSGWSHLFEADGDPGQYELKERTNTQPSASSRHKTNVFVAQIDDINGFTENARGCKPKKDSAAWDCQEYVMEVLEAANLDGILGDYDYQRIKDHLESIYNQ